MQLPGNTKNTQFGGCAPYYPAATLVQVVARDSGGTANGGDNTSDVQSFQITVNDVTAPMVRTITPTNGSKGVSPTANVRATFSEAMNEASVEATDPTTGKPTTFTLRRAGTSTTVAAMVTYNATTRTATLNPAASLRRGATYIATVRTGARDLAGNALDQSPNTAGDQVKTWRFTVRTQARKSCGARSLLAARTDRDILRSSNLFVCRHGC